MKVSYPAVGPRAWPPVVRGHVVLWDAVMQCRLTPGCAVLAHSRQSVYLPAHASARPITDRHMYGLQVVSIPYGWSEQASRSKPGPQRPATLPKVPSLLFDIEVRTSPRAREHPLTHVCFIAELHAVAVGGEGC